MAISNSSSQSQARQSQVGASRAGASQTGASQTWSSTQAYTVAVFCLILGVALGYLFRGSASPVATAASAAANANSQPTQSAQPQVTPEQQKAMVVEAVAPLLVTLKDNPNDFDTIVKVANLYYDGQQYTDAGKYYERALQLQPKNADVLTDFGTSLWYTGDADKAIAEFQTALKYEPGRASTLFNLGIVRWQGKQDPKGAVQAWQELLQKNPDYPDKEKLQEFIDRAKQHAKG
ncbi:MAG: tetratricopeptide repeat protein [Candidatus Sulfotelmatobacter sp.]